MTLLLLSISGLLMIQVHFYTSRPIVIFLLISITRRRQNTRWIVILVASSEISRNNFTWGHWDRANGRHLIYLWPISLMIKLPRRYCREIVEVEVLTTFMWAHGHLIGCLTTWNLMMSYSRWSSIKEFIFMVCFRYGTTWHRWWNWISSWTTTHTSFKRLWARPKLRAGQLN